MTLLTCEALAVDGPAVAPAPDPAGWPGWTVAELTRFHAYMSAPQGRDPGIGHNGGPALSGADACDPLSGLTQKEIFRRCVWASDESTHVRLILLCLARFFDDEARGSSMSYSQIERDCDCDESTAKREVKKAKGRWLLVETGKGFSRPQV